MKTVTGATPIIICLFCLLLAGCAPSLPALPVKGEFAGKKIATTVDSEMARYYLEHYLAGDRANLQLDTAIDRIHAEETGEPPTREYLGNLSRKISVDFAALYLARYLLEQKRNREFQVTFRQGIEEAKSTLLSGPLRRDPANDPYVVLFVPGWDWRETGHITGVDFANPRYLLTETGLANHLVAIDPHGSVEENADVIADSMLRLFQPGKKIILVSASSAGPAVALAIGRRLAPDHRQHVKAWLNIAGILKGSPVIDHYKHWIRRWRLSIALTYMGWKRQSIDSMSAAESCQRFRRIEIPEHVLIVNYVGIPLSGDVSEWAKDRYLILRKLGPNDGLTLIADAIAPGGVTLVEFGMDHFMNRDPEIDLKTLALAQLIVKALTGRPETAASEP